jgi:hypothetical protein
MRPGLLIAVLALAGCAGFDADTCRGADWYDLGFRDAIFGLQPQDEVYAHGCERYAKLDVARYAQGWREGKWEADQRRNESVD